MRIRPLNKALVPSVGTAQYHRERNGQKKMRLYIIRHADPDYENDTIIEYGKKQADMLAMRMKEIMPDIIYSSPRGRAIATAKPTCELLGMDYTIEEWATEKMEYMVSPDYEDEEVMRSSWEQSLADGIYRYKDFAKEDRKEHIVGMIDSSDEFLLRHGYKREGLLYKTINPNQEKIAVFCHGGFGGAWISHLLSLPPAMGWLHFSLHTTSVTEFAFANNENGITFPRCMRLGDVSHLSGLTRD